MINKSPSEYLARHTGRRQPGVFPRARFRAVNYTSPWVDAVDISRTGEPDKLQSWPTNTTSINPVDYGLVRIIARLFEHYGHITDPVSKHEDFGRI